MADERLTYRDGQGNAMCVCNKVHGCNLCDIPDKRLERLATFEDKAEQGLLVELGTCTYSQDDIESNTFQCNKCSALWTYMEGNPFDNNARFCHECGRKITAITIMEYNYDIDEMINREITREAAEKALEEREGKWEN